MRTSLFFWWDSLRLNSTLVVSCCRVVYFDIEGKNLVPLNRS